MSASCAPKEVVKGKLKYESQVWKVVRQREGERDKLSELVNYTSGASLSNTEEATESLSRDLIVGLEIANKQPGLISNTKKVPHNLSNGDMGVWFLPSMAINTSLESDGCFSFHLTA